MDGLGYYYFFFNCFFFNLTGRPIERREKKFLNQIALNSHHQERHMSLKQSAPLTVARYFSLKIDSLSTIIKIAMLPFGSSSSLPFVLLFHVFACGRMDHNILLFFCFLVDYSRLVTQTDTLEGMACES